MRILHTMIRVTDLEASIKFYTEVLGMQLLRKKEMPEGRFTLAFLGFADESEQSAIELTYNWDTHEYDHGNAFGHIAIEVEDVYAAADEIAARGGVVSRPAGPMKGSSTILAFVKDPDGYAIELLGPKT